MDSRSLKYVLKQASGILIVTALSVAVAQVTISSERKLYGGAGSYGTITERISSIGVTADQTSGRSHIWKAATAVIKDHPVTGVGYGNWKIASIPYEQNDYSDFTISLHAHNDLLETTGELGIFGGLAYLLIFVFTAWHSLKNLLSKKIPFREEIIFTRFCYWSCWLFCRCHVEFSNGENNDAIIFRIIICIELPGEL
jgi:O-antigen ligase